MSISLCYWVIFSPWKKTWPYIWLSFNPHQPWMLLSSFIQFGSVVLEKKFSKFLQHIFAFWLLFSLGEGRDLSFEQTWNLYTQKCLYQVWLKLFQVKMLKAYRQNGQTYRQTHERRTTGNKKISCELMIEIYGSKKNKWAITVAQY